VSSWVCGQPSSCQRQRELRLRVSSGFSRTIGSGASSLLSRTCQQSHPCPTTPRWALRLMQSALPLCLGQLGSALSPFLAMGMLLMVVHHWSAVTARLSSKLHSSFCWEVLPPCGRYMARGGSRGDFENMWAILKCTEKFACRALFGSQVLH